jgi:hypothetical protein
MITDEIEPQTQIIELASPTYALDTFLSSDLLVELMHFLSRSEAIVCYRVCSRMKKALMSCVRYHRRQRRPLLRCVLRNVKFNFLYFLPGDSLTVNLLEWAIGYGCAFNRWKEHLIFTAVRTANMAILDWFATRYRKSLHMIMGFLEQVAICFDHLDVLQFLFTMRSPRRRAVWKWRFRAIHTNAYLALKYQSLPICCWYAGMGLMDDITMPAFMLANSDGEVPTFTRDLAKMIGRDVTVARTGLIDLLAAFKKSVPSLIREVWKPVPWKTIQGVTSVMIRPCIV